MTDSSRTDRVNRFWLTLLALLLLAGGLAGALLGFGAFGDRRQSDPVLGSEVTDFVHRNEGWFWPAVAAVAVLLGVLALRWLLVQLRSERLSRIDLEPDRSRGETVVATRAVTDALTEEVAGYRGVGSASASVRGKTTRPELVMTVGLEDRADLRAVRERIEEQAVAHARQALDAADLPVVLRLQLGGGGTGSRVR